MATKKEIFKAHLAEWLAARSDRKKRGEMVRALARTAKVNEKSVPRSFSRIQLVDTRLSEQRGRKRYYLPDVIAALEEVWHIGSEACGENLHPMIGEYINTQIAAGDWRHSDEATAKLRAMSLGSAKVYIGGFSRTRRHFGGKSTTQRSSVIAMVPIRMDGWDTAETGVTQIDTVAHCGYSVAGDYAYTVNGIDVATSWAYDGRSGTKGNWRPERA